MKQPDRRNWKKRFYKTVPMVELDIEGNPDFNKPIPQDPPLNKAGFWIKPKTTSSILNERINERSKNKKQG